MADSDSSALSSAPTTDDEAMELKMSKATGLDRYFKPAPKKKEASPEPPRREPSPPHEYTLADNDAIAFLVMFRSRFSDAFPKSLPHYGPQDLERGVSDTLPDEGVERYLCALLSLVLNRKKDVEKGHYGRALEDAISSNMQQWPVAWQGQNPLHGAKSFNTMSAEERLALLRALALWALNESETVKALIKESWKQTRRDDDRNQPRSVQPWFSDSYRRRFWLVEGQEDSYFRIYRENDGKTSKTNTWFSVASTIEDVNALADKFAEEGTLNSRMNADKLRSAIPRFEQGEEKRRRREYRQAQKARFTRPEPGFSLYEGRTRGKRAKYTFDDGEDVFDSDDVSTRRSTRHVTPLDAGPVVTASGRQVKSRVGGVYGESLSTDQRREHDYDSGIGEAEGDDSDDQMPTTAPAGRSRRASRPSGRAQERYNDQGDSNTESDEQQSEGEEWSGNENEPDDDDESEGEMSEDDVGEDDFGGDEGDMQRSLVVQLRYRPKRTPVPPSSRARTPLLEVNGTISTINTFGGDATREDRLPNPSDHAVQPVAVDFAPMQTEKSQPRPQQEEPNMQATGLEVHQTTTSSVPEVPIRPVEPLLTQPVQTNGIHQPSPSYSLAPPEAVKEDAQISNGASLVDKPRIISPSLPEMSTGISTPKSSDGGHQQQSFQPQAHVMDVS